MGAGRTVAMADRAVRETCGPQCRTCALIRAAAAFLLLCMLGGCLTGPDYKRPEIDTPSTWRFEEKDAQAAANPAWWEQFNDPALTELIETALRENEDMRIATARIEEYEGRLQTTRAPLFPQLGASAAAGRNRTTQRGPSQLKASAVNPVQEFQSVAAAVQSVEQAAALVASGGTTAPGRTIAAPRTATPELALQNPANSYQTSLTASWQLDLWGRLRRATEAARANLLAATEARKGVAVTLASAVAFEYVALRDLDRQLEIAEATAKTREGSYNLFKLRFKGGVVSQVELSQAESEYALALSVIPQVRQAVAQRENALRVLLGHNPGEIERGKPLAELTLPVVPEGLPSSLIEERPDIRQAEQDLVAANAQIDAARAQYFPDISLTGSLGSASTSLSNLFTGPARVWSYAAAVSQPIFTGGAIAGQVKTAKAVQEETLERYKQTIHTAFREVEDALAAQHETREQLAAQERQVAALQRYAHYARRRFDSGYTSYIEVLDAERGLFQAELSLSQTRAALFQSLVNLYRAMGRGWDVDEARTPAAENHP